MSGFTRAAPKVFTSWSNSRWNDYAQCPARAKYKHLDKLAEPKSGPMHRGIQIAKMEEDFFAGHTKTLPVWGSSTKVESRLMDPKNPATWPNWEGNVVQAKKNGLAIHPTVAPLLKLAKKQPDLFFEQNWGFDKNWNVVDYFDWKNCWLRIKVDFGWGIHSKNKVIHLRDGKSGKYSMYDIEKYMEQLRLYAAGGAAKFPHITEFHVQLVFTDMGMVYPDEPLVITRAEALKLQKKFSKQVTPMFNDTRFDPSPNRGCQWCHFRADNGGPCKY